VEDNLAWFDINHLTVASWSKDTVKELGLDVVQTTNSSTDSTVTFSEATSTEQSLPPSDSANVQTFGFILPIVISSVLLVDIFRLW